MASITLSKANGSARDGASLRIGSAGESARKDAATDVDALARLIHRATKKRKKGKT
jgi:hypothetical protein